jgi:plasmid stabilization system protein ParE
MPKAWSKKDERQYEHIEESSKKRGKSQKRAKEIAARTVNKRRRQEGRTPKKATEGTGNPQRPLDQRTVDELRNIAADMNINGRSKMKKQELIGAIRKTQ